MNDPVDPVALETPPLPPPCELEEASPAEPQPVPPQDIRLTLETLGSAIERLETAVAAGVASMLGEFRDKLALDRFKEDQITKLHEELQAYKNDLIFRASRQILQGVIRLHDDLGKVVDSLRQKPTEELTPEMFFRQLEGFQDDVELLLGQHGVERFEVGGEEFDPRRQTALRTIAAEDPAQVGRVAERLRPGFLQGEAFLQKERVAVFAAANAKA
jgi:molecular chaperone GrpE (heat shock protein)